MASTLECRCPRPTVSIQFDMVEQRDNGCVQWLDFGPEGLGGFGALGQRHQIANSGSAKIPGNNGISAQRLFIHSVNRVDDFYATQVGSFHGWMKARQCDRSDRPCYLHRVALPVLLICAMVFTAAVNVRRCMSNTHTVGVTSFEKRFMSLIEPIMTAVSLCSEY